MSNDLNEISAGLSSAFQKIEADVRLGTLTSEAIIAKDVSELAALYPKIKPVIPEIIPLIQALPFPWAPGLATLLSIVATLSDSLTANPNSSAA